MCLPREVTSWMGPLCSLYIYNTIVWRRDRASQAAGAQGHLQYILPSVEHKVVHSSRAECVYLGRSPPGWGHSVPLHTYIDAPSACGFGSLRAQPHIPCCSRDLANAHSPTPTYTNTYTHKQTHTHHGREHAFGRSPDGNMLGHRSTATVTHTHRQTHTQTDRLTD